MPVNVAARRFLIFALAVIAIAFFYQLLIAGSDGAWAQGNPFGVGRPRATAPAPAESTGIIGWILAKQAEFYRGLSGLVRAAKADGNAVWGLFGLSFLYGIFHAAGPGHGKAVISAYLVANEETWRRGIVLSFASAMVQAMVAVLIVGIAAALIGVTAKTMGDTVRYIEIASYGLIALLGARLLWVKGRGFIAAWQALDPRPIAVAAMADGDHQHHHHEDGHHHHDQSPGHGHDAHCGHSHGPEPQELAGPGGWRRGLAAILGVGLRPCSGAILVLVFALAQGLFWAGVVSTFVMGLGTAITVAAIATLAVGAKAAARRMSSSRNGYGSLALRGLEVAASALVLIFGLALLAGYMASERLVGF